MKKKMISIGLMFGMVLTMLNVLPFNRFVSANGANFPDVPVLDGTDSFADTSKIVDCINGDVNALEPISMAVSGGKTDQAKILAGGYSWVAGGDGFLTFNGEKPFVVWKVPALSKVELLTYAHNSGGSNVSLSYSKDGVSFTELVTNKVLHTKIDTQEKVGQYNLSSEMDFGTPNFDSYYQSANMPSNNGNPVYFKVTYNVLASYSIGISMVRTSSTPLLNGTDSITDTSKIVDSLYGLNRVFESASFGPSGNKKDAGVMINYFYPVTLSGNYLVNDGVKPYAVWKTADATRVELLAYVLSLGDVLLSYSLDGETFTNFTKIKVNKTVIDSQSKVNQYNLASEMDYGDSAFTANYYTVDMPANNGNPVYFKVTMNSDYKYSTALSMVRTGALPVFNGTDSIANTSKMADCLDGDVGVFETSSFGPDGNKKDTGMILNYYYPLTSAGGYLVSNGVKPYAVWRVAESTRVEFLAYMLSIGDVLISYSKDGTNYVNFSPIKARKTTIDSQEKVVQYNLVSEMDYGDANFTANLYSVDMPYNNGNPVYFKVTMNSDNKWSTAISMLRTAQQPVFAGTDSMTDTSNQVDCVDGNINAFEFDTFGPTGNKTDRVMMLGYFYPWTENSNPKLSNGVKPYAVWRVKENSFVDVLAYYFVYDTTGISISYSTDGETYVDYAVNEISTIAVDSQEKVEQCNLASQMIYGMEYFNTVYHSVKAPANSGKPVYIKLTYTSQNNYSTAIAMFRSNDKMLSQLLNINRTVNIVTGIALETTVSNFITKITAASGTIKILDKLGAEVTTGLIGTGMRVQLINGTDLSDEIRAVIYGDTNGDGLVGIGDLASIKSHIMKQTLLTGAFKTAGDIYSKGSITVSDLLAVKKAAMGIGTISQNVAN